MQRGFIQIPILIAIILGVFVVSGAGYVGVKQYQNNQVENSKQETTTQNEEATSTDELSEVEKLRQEIDELKKQGSSSAQTQKQKTAASTPVKRTILSNAQVVSRVKPATVFIETTEGSGSGMILDSSGYILTNAHVLWDVSAAKVKLSDGRSLSAEVVGRDEIVDLAILKIIGSNFSSVTLGNSDVVAQGDDVFTLGYPFGLEGDVSFKEGTISRRISSGDTTYLETSAEIHPGNSGGPLVNKYGEVVGINTASYGQTIEGVTVGETIKLAIPVNVAKTLIPQLKAGREIVIDHAQYESQSSGGSDVATDFAIKSQCQQLGQQRKNKEDQEYDDGSILSGGTVAYGYSITLNTCVYGRVYTIYKWDVDSGNRKIEPMIYSAYIDNLMTEERIYTADPIYIKYDVGVTSDTLIALEEQIKGLWAIYNALIE